MNIEIVTGKEEYQGSMSRYLDGLIKYIPNVKPFYIHNRTYRPFFSFLRDYIYYPLYVRERSKADLLHFIDPSYGHYLFIKKKNIKTIITCHDIYPMVFNIYSGFNKIFYDITIKGMLNADRIIADSRSTKKDLIEYLNIGEDKIEVVYLGIESKYKKIEVKKDTSKKIILHVGAEQYKGRKNVYGLILAFYRLKKLLPDIKLIQVGVPVNTYSKLIFDLGLENDIQFRGFIDEDTLIRLYSMADVFVFPSFYEGFGFPPLEAMACGCPVIVSNVASLPEVVGDAGIFINPHDTDDLVEALYRVITEEGLQKDLVKKGFERAKFFSWKKTAEQTYEIYEEVWNGK